MFDLNRSTSHCSTSYALEDEDTNALHDNSVLPGLILIHKSIFFLICGFHICTLLNGKLVWCLL